MSDSQFTSNVFYLHHDAPPADAAFFWLGEEYNPSLAMFVNENKIGVWSQRNIAPSEDALRERIETMRALVRTFDTLNGNAS